MFRWLVARQVALPSLDGVPSGASAVPAVQPQAPIVRPGQPQAAPATRQEAQEQVTQIKDRLSILQASQALQVLPGKRMEQFNALVEQVKANPEFIPSQEDMKTLASIVKDLNTYLRGDALKQADSTSDAGTRFTIRGQGFMERGTGTLMATRQRLEVLMRTVAEPERRAKLQGQIDDIDERLVRKADFKALTQFAGNDPAKQRAVLKLLQDNPELQLKAVMSKHVSTGMLLGLVADPRLNRAVINQLLDNPGTPHVVLMRLLEAHPDQDLAETVARHPNGAAPSGPAAGPEAKGIKTISADSDAAYEEWGSSIARSAAMYGQSPGSIHTLVKQGPNAALHGAGQAHANSVMGGVLGIPTAQVAAIGVSNVGGTGVGLFVTAMHNVSKRQGYMADEPPLPDGSRRYMQSQARQIAVGTGAVQEAFKRTLPISAGVNLGSSSSVAYARVIRPDENATQIARQSEPPTQLDLASGKVTLRPGEEIAYRSQRVVGATVGTVTPSGVWVAASYENQKDWLTAIRANGGSPPTYTVHIEPDTVTHKEKVSGGYGPFAVETGAGQMSAVQYDFQMTHEAMQQYLVDGKLPELPDPRKALKSDGTMNTEVFNAFKERLKDKQGNEVPGITLQSFGRVNEKSVYGDFSATVASARGNKSWGQCMVATGDQVCMTTSKETGTSKTVLIRGTVQSTMRVEHAHKYRPQEETATLGRTYHGATVTFRIADNGTPDKEFRSRIEHLNTLLGRTDIAPTLRGNHGSSVGMIANATPDHIRALAAMDPASPETLKKLDEIAAALPSVTREQLVELLEAVRAAGPQPPPTARALKQMEKHQTTLEMLQLEKQGKLIADFMAGGDDKLAALDRLARAGGLPPLVNVRIATETYQGRIRDIGAIDFLDAPVSTLDKLRTNTHMREFTNCVDKIELLKWVARDAEADQLLSPDEKSGIVRQVNESLALLDAHMDKMLVSKSKCDQILERLQVAGSTIGGYWSDPYSGLNLYHDTFGHYDNPDVRNAYMDKVVDATLRISIIGGKNDKNIAAYAGMMKSFTGGSGATGISQLLRVCAHASERNMLPDVLSRVPPGDLQKMVGRMNRDERQQLQELVGDNAGARATLKQAIAAADKASEPERRKAEQQLEDLNDALYGLGSVMPI